MKLDETWQVDKDRTTNNRAEITTNKKVMEEKWQKRMREGTMKKSKGLGTSVCVLDMFHNTQ